MRSRTLSELPGRCPRCWIRSAFCICAEIPRLQPRTQVVLVRHEREAWKSTGTARVALEALGGSQLVEYGEDGVSTDEQLRALSEGAALLFPETGLESAPLPQAPTRLIVLDGTW